MKPIATMKLGPQRTSVCNDDGSWTVTVTPPPWTEFSASTLRLTEQQYHRCLRWLAGEGLIQEMLSDLSDAEREILMTGVNAAEFDEAFRDEDE